MIDPRRTLGSADAAGPHFSPFLLIGLALRPLPRRPLQVLLSTAMRTMTRRHPEVFDRLRALGPSAIVIDATDLPFLFQFRPNTPGDKLRIVERNDDAPAIARIRGPLGVLLGLLQGTQDGDALFFSRVLTIEGDTAAVLMLRNAIDGAEIDLPADFAAIFGRAGRMIERGLRFPLGLAAALSRDAATLQAALNAPVATDLRLQATTVKQLRDRLDAMGQELRRAKQRREA